MDTELADLLALHNHKYDGDCGDDYGCSCGWDPNPERPHYDGVDYAAFNLHLAAILTENGYHK